MIDFLLEIDKKLFLFLNGLNSGFFDWLMYYISEKTTWIPLYMIILVLVIKKYKWKGLFFLLFATLLVVLSDQGSVMMKNTFMRLRPCKDPDLQGLVHMVRGRCGGMYGFVSSHAANTFALAALVSMIFRKDYKYITAIMFTYASLNAYSRIYLGVHYPGDVIAGAILGWGIGITVFLLWHKFTQLMKMNVSRT